jgi:hypothetical protein
MGEYEHKNRMDRADNLLDEGKEIKTETIEVIHGGNIFLISELMYSCSEGLAGVYTSPGNLEMSHDEKRIMAQGMLYGCIKDILKIPSKKDKDSLKYIKDSTTMIILNERALNLNDVSLSHGGLEKVLEYYSIDIKNLSDYIETSRKLNINGNTDLGDNDKKLDTS